METTRRFLAFLMIVGLLSGGLACRHIAGGCDCEHSNYNRCQGCAAGGTANSSANGAPASLSKNELATGR